MIVKQELTIILAMTLDLFLGDPRWLPHPVRGIGFLASHSELIMRKLFRNSLRIAGICTALVVIFTCGILSWFFIHLLSSIHPFAGMGAGLLIVYVSIAPRDLYNHSNAVLKALKSGSIDNARNKVAMIVGRDTQNLSEPEIVRASVETVAESLVDGVTAPIFYAIIFGPIGAICYRAINTLDSMFGHKNQRYIYFGWASARIDDIANYLPARLSSPFIALGALIMRLDVVNCIRILFRDGRKHHSPNSGLSEAAFAGALGIQLGGLNFYDGIPDKKPVIGNMVRHVETNDIQKANILMILTTVLFTIVCIIFHYLLIKAIVCHA
jgi:adenosylcobinamide-phosphate synthase